ncbi:MAG: hypothetical protein JOZ19_00320 [Rubrobacter sp.]|nr:hypothetical protein [Rubrobacter sp.]
MIQDDSYRAITLAEQWLLQSGIQERQTSLPMHGGVHAWYDLPKASFSFFYTEITGYAVTTLLYLYYLRSDPVYLERAKDAAEWLLTYAREPQTGVLRCRLHPTGWEQHACAFDNGMCLNGLVNVFRCTGEKRYLTAALELGVWLVDTMQAPNGSLLAKYDVSTKTPSSPGGKWSHMSGSFLLKVAIGLLNLGDASGDIRYTEAARALCEWGATLQEPDGRFQTSPLGDTFLHPHCYAAEGLLVAGTMLREPRWLQAATEAVAWISPYQRVTGGFPAFFEEGKFVPVESAEMTAQVLRLWLLLPHNERPALDAEAATYRIIADQVVDPQKEVRGGFVAGDAWFHREPHDHTGQHVNSWVSMFCLQALALAHEGGEIVSPFLLV